MINNRQAWISRIGHTIVLSNILSKRIAEKSVGTVSPELRRTIESIAFKIEAARKLNLNYAIVQELSEGADFLVPSLKDRQYSKCPHRDWLRVNAAFVFNYCQAAGLKVELAPYTHRGAKKLTSSITIEWYHLLDLAPPCVSERSPLLNVLSEHPIKYPPTQEDEICNRTALVLKYAPVIIESIENAIAQKKNEVQIFAGPVELSKKEREDACDDVVTLCEILGVETHSVPTRIVKDGVTVPTKLVVAISLRK